MIESIYEFRAEFKTHVVMNRKFLLQPDVKAVQARPTYGAHAAIPESKEGRIRIRRGTKPLQADPGNELFYVLGWSVAIRARPTRVRGRVVVPVDREGESAVQTVNQADVPAPHNCIDHRI